MGVPAEYIGMCVAGPTVTRRGADSPTAAGGRSVWPAPTQTTPFCRLSVAAPWRWPCPTMGPTPIEVLGAGGVKSMWPAPTWVMPEPAVIVLAKVDKPVWPAPTRVSPVPTVALDTKGGKPAWPAPTRVSPPSTLYTVFIPPTRGVGGGGVGWPRPTSADPEFSTEATDWGSAVLLGPGTGFRTGSSPAGLLMSATGAVLTLLAAAGGSGKFLCATSCVTVAVSACIWVAMLCCDWINAAKVGEGSGSPAGLTGLSPVGWSGSVVVVAGALLASSSLLMSDDSSLNHTGRARFRCGCFRCGCFRCGCFFFGILLCFIPLEVYTSDGFK